MHGRSRLVTVALSTMVLALLVGATWGFQSSQAKQGIDKPTLFPEQTTSASDILTLPSYILAGGQNGLWFYPSQYPELYKVNFSSNGHATVPLSTAPGFGTVWSGGWNGSNWLITGWGWGDS
ncbi:MAG: hypothetical protein ABSA33_04045, partial [Candidatus Micrarchaeaceae archaeon]